MSVPPHDDRPPIPDSAADDPTIPVLNERLHLHALDMDIDLPDSAKPAPQLDTAGQSVDDAAAPPESAVEAAEPPASKVAEAPAAAEEQATSSETPPEVAAPATERPAQQAPATLTPAEVDALRDAVLARMQGKVTEHINETLHDLLQPAIDDAILRLADEAKLALRLTVQELVERALREELRARASNDGTDSSSS